MLADVSQGGLRPDQPGGHRARSPTGRRGRLAGFSVNWNGAGGAGQAPATTAYNQRLQWVSTPPTNRAAEGIPFKLTLNYKTAGHVPVAHMIGGLEYFVARYGSDPALDHTHSPKPEMIWTGSSAYTDEEKDTLSRAFRSRIFLIADDKNRWDANSAANFDGNKLVLAGGESLQQSALVRRSGRSRGRALLGQP